MRVVLACLTCMIVGMFLGAYFVTAGVQATAAAVAECIQDPESCGLDSDSFDPKEQFVPT